MESVFLKRAIQGHAGDDMALPGPQRGVCGRKGSFAEGA